MFIVKNKTHHLVDIKINGERVTIRPKKEVLVENNITGEQLRELQPQLSYFEVKMADEDAVIKRFKEMKAQDDKEEIERIEREKKQIEEMNKAREENAKRKAEERVKKDKEIALKGKVEVPQPKEKPKAKPKKVEEVEKPVGANKLKKKNEKK